MQELVTGARRDVDTPLHLSELTRAVLAMQQCEIYDHWLMAKLLAEKSLEVSAVIAALKRSKNAIVLRARREGLPACAGVSLPFGVTVKCPRCNAVLQAIPCVRCAPTWADHYENEPEERRCNQYQELPEPKTFDTTKFEPTEYLPGTWAKMDVMQERIKLGFPIWHPDDRLFPGEDLD